MNALIAVALVMRIVQTVEVGPADSLVKADEVTTWIGEDFVRIESNTRVHILDAEHGTYTVLRKDTLTYWQATHDELVGADLVSPTAVIALSVDEDDGGPAVASPMLAKTGAKHRTRFGECEELESTRPTLAGKPSFVCMGQVGVDWGALQSVAERVFTSEASRTRDFYTQAKALSGFPVQTRLLSDDGEVRHTVTAVERISTDAHELTKVPSGYERVRGPAGH